MVRTPLDETTQNAGLYDLTIDGNRAKIPKKVDGFYTGVRPQDPRQDSDITVERVEVMNCCGYGFDPHEQTIPLRIADSVSHHNGLDGFVADFLVDSVYEQRRLRQRLARLQRHDQHRWLEAARQRRLRQRLGRLGDPARQRGHSRSARYPGQGRLLLRQCARGHLRQDC